LPNDSKHNEASFSTTLTDLLYLLVAQMLKYPDLAIFVVIDRRTEPITLPLAYACGVINWYLATNLTKGKKIIRFLWSLQGFLWSIQGFF
jgi:hypothetical protein